MSHYRCSQCSASTRVTETRVAPDGLRRRRKCDGNHQFSTIEIPLEAPGQLRALFQWLSRQQKGFDPELAEWATQEIDRILHNQPTNTEE